MSHTAHPAPPPVRRGMIRNTLIFGLAALAVVGGFAAWRIKKTIFTKPGEQALSRFAPSQTWVAATLDTRPTSLGQVRVLARIGEAIKNENLDELLQKALKDSNKDTSEAARWAKSLTGSGAVLMWPKSEDNLKDTPHLIAALEVKDKNEITALLEKEGKPVNGVYTVRISQSAPQSKLYATFNSEYVLLGSSVEALQVAQAVDKGSTPSLTTQADYQSLRSKVPGESNMLLYTSPRLYKAAQAVAKEQGQVSNEQEQHTEKIAELSAQGMVAGLTVVEEGLRVDSSVQVPPAFGNTLSKIAPLNGAGKNLPEGPLAVISVSQPGLYFTVVEAVVNAVGGETQKDWNKGKADFEKELGLSVDSDIVPALSGQWTMAAYTNDQNRSIHFAALADDGHSAKPAALFARVLSIAKKKQPNDDLGLTEENRDGVTYYLAKLGYKGELPPVKANGEITEPSVLGANSAISTTNTDTPAPVMAAVGESLLFATSPTLLDQSVQSVQGKGALTDINRVPKESVTAFVAYPDRMMEIARPYLDEIKRNSHTETALTVDDVTAIYGNAPMVASGNVQNGYTTSRFFMPLRYEKLIHIVAVLAKEAKANEDREKIAGETAKL